MKFLDKIKIPLIVGGLAVVLLIVIQIRSCINENRVRESSVIQGQYEAYKEEIEKEKEDLFKEKEDVERQVKNLKAAISELTEKTEKYREEIKIKDSELEELKGQFSLIDEEDKDGQILNLRLQVGNLETQLDKALKGWEAAEAKAVGWERAFNLKDDYCKKLEAQLEMKDNLLKIAESVIYAKDKEIRGMKISKTIERVITWPIAGYGVFKVFQGALK